MARTPPSSRTPVWLLVLRYAFLAVVVILLLFGYQGVRIYTDWLWFGEMGRTSVYATTILAGLKLFFGFGLLFKGRVPKKSKEPVPAIPADTSPAPAPEAGKT